jgi:hypothetical protein
MPVHTGTPITITLYNADDSVKKDYTRSIIRWGILKKVLRLSKAIDLDKPEEMSEEDVDAIASLVTEIFGNEFSVKDLDEGADLAEMIACLQAIVAKASGIVANPTPPAR